MSPPPKPPLPPQNRTAATAKGPVKVFSVKPAIRSSDGQKIVVYAKTGTGKTTLASMAPNPVFIAFDTNASKIVNPITSKEIPVIAGVTSFQDARDALHQDNLFGDECTIVIDTLTKLEAVSEQYIFDNYPAPGKQGSRASHMRAYGWDGPAHYLDTMRLLLADLDYSVSKGRNVLLLAQQGQVKIPHSAGLDYLEDGPKLSHTNQYSSRMEVCEWSDHVLRIGYLDFSVAADNDKARVGKVQGDTAERAIFSGGAAHYVGKSRPIGGKHLPPVIQFSHAADDSLWQMMFRGGIP